MYAAAFRLANLDDGVPITSKTSFHLSLSKQFTASAIALLIQDGKLQLDDPVEKYIPEARRYGPQLQLKHPHELTVATDCFGATFGDRWMPACPRRQRVQPTFK